MPDPLDPVEALRLSSALLALLPECKGATHSEAVSHCAECCFGSGYELHGPEDQVILDAAIALAALAALPVHEEGAGWWCTPDCEET